MDNYWLQKLRNYEYNIYFYWYFKQIVLKGFFNPPHKNQTESCLRKINYLNENSISIETENVDAFISDDVLSMKGISSMHIHIGLKNFNRYSYSKCFYDIQKITKLSDVNSKTQLLCVSLKSEDINELYPRYIFKEDVCKH